LSADRHTDFLIVGAGFSGLVSAERLASHGWNCVVVDRRHHLGGNAWDRTDAAGVRYHPYGPHYFRTNSTRVREYLSRFTQWHDARYIIKSHALDRYWSFPVNLETFEEYIGRPSSTAEFESWLAQRKLPIEHPANSEEAILSKIGREFYELFYEGYTLKQWRRHPRDLDAAVCARVPIRTNRDDRYVDDAFQALPAGGYTALFENLLAATPRIDLRLGVDFEEAKKCWKYRHLIFTGPIDEYFGRKFGPLPYRSLRFEHESFDADRLRDRLAISGKPGFWQPVLQVNHPEASVPWTRTVELKHITGQQLDSTVVTREFPKDWTIDDEPFYPVPAPDAREAYDRYAALAAAEPNVSFIGRLATYRYYNMDQVTAMALTEADKLIRRYGRS
jgi:UDP-galactopyranose mutase